MGLYDYILNILFQYNEMVVAMKTTSKSRNEKNNGANLGFEQKLWLAADKLRSNMDAAEYKHVVLGLIFLKYISDAFNEVYEKLKKDPTSDPEDVDEYVSRRVFWVPKEARWEYLQKNAKKPEIGKLIDEALDSMERGNRSLKGVLLKNYARPGLNKQRLGELIDLIGTIGLGDRENKIKDKIEAGGNITPTIVLAEMKKRFTDWGRNDFDEKLDFIRSKSVILPLDDTTAIEAGRIRSTIGVHGMGIVDCILLAASRLYGMKVLTGDPHFKNLREADYIGE